MNIGLISNLLRENSINNNKVLGNSLEKLSSGLQINKASDNASGLAISDKLRTQASGIKQGIDNANSAIAMMNIADKAMGELSNILDIIKAKAIQMNTDTTNEEGRKIIKTDILKLIESYDDIVCRTNYNQTPLLNGCATPFDFQVGDDSNEIVSVNVDSLESKKMGEADPYRLKNFITGFNMPVITPEISITLDPPSSTISTYFSVNELDYNTQYDMDDFKDYYLTIPTNEILDEDLVYNIFSIAGNSDPLGLIDVSVKINASNFLTNGETNPYSKINGGTYFPKDTVTKDYFDELSTLDDSINGLYSTQVEHFVSPLLGDYYKIKDGTSLNGPLINETAPSILLQEQILNFSVTSYTHDTSISESSLLPFIENVIIESFNAEKLLPVYDSNDIITSFITDNSLSSPLSVRNDGKYLPTSISSNPTPEVTPELKNLISNCNDVELIRNDDSPTLAIQAQNLMRVIDEALSQLNAQRANVGVGTNQLESTARNQMTNYVNIKNAESIIRDVSYEEESSNFNKANIISQAGSYVQSQANEIDKQSVAQLLK